MIRPLFEKYQKYLLAFANTNYGHKYIALGKHPKGLKVVKVTPDSIHYEDGGVRIASFHSKSPYLNKFEQSLTALDIAMESYGKLKAFKENPALVIPHFQGLILPQRMFPNIMFSSFSFYPDAHAESTSVDGTIYGGWNATWATVRGATSGDAAFTSDGDDAGSGLDQYVQAGTRLSAGDYNIFRGFTLFDSSSLSDSDVILATNEHIYVGSADSNDNDGKDYIVAVTSTPASNTALVAGDFDQLGTTAQSNTIDLTSMADGWNTFAFNATGIGNVSKTGVSKFGFREGHDVENEAPVADFNLMTGYSSEAGASTKPTLEVIYSYGGSPLFFNTGVALG
jgi:hypothetical protein